MSARAQTTIQDVLLAARRSGENNARFGPYYVRLATVNFLTHDFESHPLVMSITPRTGQLFRQAPAGFRQIELFFELATKTQESGEDAELDQLRLAKMVEDIERVALGLLAERHADGGLIVQRVDERIARFEVGHDELFQIQGVSATITVDY